MRRLSNQKRQPSLRRPSFFKPSLELLEDRRLLNATGLIQGTVFDQTGAAQSGALLTLTQPGSPSFSETQTTGASGTYLFTGLNPGTYQLVETPPTGYGNSSNQIKRSPVETISSVNSSTITVTIPPSVTLSVDGNQFQYPQGVDNPSSPSGVAPVAPIEVLNYTINGDSEVGVSVGQIIATANTGSGFGSPFYTFCIDLANFLGGDANVYSVQPQADLSGIGGSNVQVGNSGKIAYLYNQYGQSTLPSMNAAALQVAIWSLEYNQDPIHFDQSEAGNAFQLNGIYSPLPPQSPTTFTTIVNQAKVYINDATQNGQAIFLAPGAANQGGEQGMIVPGYANFTNFNITTSQQPASATVGSSIADKATVTGLVNPSSTDTVTFNLYSSATVQNNTTLLFTDTETVSISGSTATATSAGYTTSATGTDYWVATFNGDSSNSTASSAPTAEPVTITPNTPSINTSQQPASAVVGSSIADKATVTGLVNANSTDTVTFNLYSSSTTQDSTTLLFSDTETVSLSGSTATATSAGYTTSTTGTDYWVATFNGDSNNNAVTSGATDEPVSITPATPSINTSQQPASAVVGSSIADKATVTGLVNANSTDTVTFNLYSSSTTQDSTTLLFSDTETVSLSGSTATATSAGYTTSTTGTDYWVATFNGDSNNNAVTSGATAEPVTITPNTPSINTSQQPASATVGTSVADQANISGLVNANSTDTVTFNLYNNPNGTGTALFTSTVGVTLGSGGTATATSAGYVASNTGTDYWVATFNGDSNNTAVTSGTALEPVTVGSASPAITTTPYVVTTTGPGGQFATIGFWHNNNGQAEIQNFDSGPSSKLLGNSLASNFPHLFGVSNPYTSAALASFGATSLASLTNAQVATVYLDLWTPNGLQKNTYVQAFAVALGSYASGGAGSFNVGSNGAAFGVANNTKLSVAQILQIVDSNFSPSTGLFYGGDSTKTSAANNVLDAINSSGETSGGSSTVSIVNLNDSAILTGGYHEGGTITFYLFAPGVTPNSTDSNSVYSDTVTVSGDGTYSTATGTNPGGYMPMATGTYQWVAVYSGDGNNNSVTSPFGSEPWTVGQGSPTITTIPGGTVELDSNTALTDTATLSDGSNPTGTITFYLFAPGVTPTATYSNNVYSDTVTVNGNGTYTTSAGNNPGGFVPAVTGTFEWVAVYSGDSNNAPATSSFGDEPETVTTSGPVAAGDFATIGFWHNKNGQAVINSFNGSSSATGLGNWLATNFSSLFGTSNPYISADLSSFHASSLAGLTNAQIATIYLDLWNPSGVTKNTYVQAFAVALGVYADTASLGYNSTAASYGFNNVSGGGGNLTFNIGSNGAAFGVVNNTSLSVMTVLQDVNAAFDAALGTFFNGNSNQQTMTSDLNNVLNGINTKGDIS